mmetsp:Transcript_38943/g.59201  ORF Transcript_38943/g.59201 Transcript_38943/m.59201 type:complete len:83 (+) Transcript_38943:3479-3727(+)
MVSLVQQCPMIIMNKLDFLVEKINAVFSKNAPILKKKDAQGVERSQNLIRGILRVVDLIQRNPESAQNHSFQQWFQMNVIST